MSSSQTLPPPQGPEYARCIECGHIEPEHRPGAGPCLVCDCATYAPATSAGVAPATDQAAPTDWIDGHPQLEAIAAAVWEQCGRSDSGTCVEDDPRNIAVAAYAAVLPAPADRAAVLREAADAATEQLQRNPWTTAADVIAELRRMAAEAQQPEAEPDDYERTTGHLITCLAVAGGDSDPCCPACQVPRCDVEVVGGGRCTKPARHWAPGSDDPHLPEPAVEAQQPKEAAS